MNGLVRRVVEWTRRNWPDPRLDQQQEHISQLVGEVNKAQDRVHDLEQTIKDLRAHDCTHGSMIFSEFIAAGGLECPICQRHHLFARYEAYKRGEPLNATGEATT